MEVIYLRTLLIRMGFVPHGYTAVHDVNNACIEWSNVVIDGRERAKNIDIWKHFAHEAIQNGRLCLVPAGTSEQLDQHGCRLQPRLNAACMAGILGRRWS